MDNKPKLKQNPIDKAGFFSKLTFAWTIPLFIKGYKRPLEKEDLYDIQKGDESKELGDKLSKIWDTEIMFAKLAKRKASYVRALIRCFGVQYGLAGILAFIEECILRVGQPLCLGGLIRYYNNPDSPTWVGILFSLGITLGSFFYICTHHPLLWNVQHSGMKMRIASCSLIYRKAIRLSQAALGKATVGQMVNLLSNDVNRFDTSVIFLHYLWVGPLQTIIVTTILWSELGPSCIAGIMILVLSVPLQSWLGKVFSRLRAATAIRTDERIRVMNEIVNAMRVIKMYAWEKPFVAMVNEARRKEINIIMKTNYYRALNMSLFFTSSKMIVFLSLLTYVLTGNVLTAEKVFVTTSLINNVRLSMTLFLPYAVAMGSEALISCKRIQKFLEMEERDEMSERIDNSNLRPKPKDCFLQAHSISARWLPTSKDDDLKDISFNTKAGELLAIVGEVGSGKSSLLQSILNEFPIKNGSLTIRGKISYASQEPWIFSGTVKENILFGQQYNAKKYQEVIKVCALERDLKILPEGENSLVGERGVSLSGGQKARISLARAVYYDADIYLLDDPLSAVDADVGKQLYNECITKFLKNKVKILVTHQLQFVKNATQILILHNGCIKGLGTFEQFLKQGINLTTLNTKQEEVESPTKTNSPTHQMPILQPLKQNSLRRQSSFIDDTVRIRRDSENWLDSAWNVYETGDDTNVRNDLCKIGIDGSLTSITNKDNFEDPKSTKISKENIGEEKKSVGSVGFKIYRKYLTAGGGKLILSILLTLSITTQFLFTGSDYWLSYWTNQEQRHFQSLVENNNSGNTTVDPLDRSSYIWIYTGMTFSLFFLAFVRTVIYFVICMTASRTLHGRMLSSVLEAPIKFFDTHPIGVILNRFAKDLGHVDDLLPPTLYDFFEILLVFTGIIVIVAIVNVWFLVPTIVLGVLFVLIRSIYLHSARDIKRLESITRSPVFTHLSSSLNGLTTIRAMKAEQNFIDGFDDRQNLHSSAWFLFLCTTRCFGIWLDVLTCIYITVVTFSFLGMDGQVLGGDVGLAISSAMMLSGMFQWGVRQSAEVENQMTSVERIIEYSKIEPEIPRDSNKQTEKEVKNWPKSGNLEFKEVFLYYDPQDAPVLKNLNFTIDSSSKVGIVGRTGAGKSSLLTCLFRLTQPQGTISIDSIDTDTIDLSFLRQSISIIPQDPTLFNGTVRQNLDPFTRYNDQEIWNAIEEVQLKKAVCDMSGGLNAAISEGGSNLSVGQRQLVCLARAILKHNKILVMDEATANVDPSTDGHIQETIRTKFSDCTVITIAHRLNTIMDSDKIMVMDAGQLMEYDEPYKLLEDGQTIFSQLVEHTGPSSSRHLRQIARKTYFEKHPTLIEETAEMTDESNVRRRKSIEDAGEKLEETEIESTKL